MDPVKLLIIITALAIAGIALKLGVYRGERNLLAVRLPPLVVGAVLGVVVIFGLVPAIGQVPAGHRGVVLRFGGVTGQVLGEGIYLVTPFSDSVILMNVQTRAYAASRVDAASRDLQTVTSDLVVNYRLDSARVAEIYQNLRDDYEVRVISPSVEEVVKRNTARFEAERLITDRISVKDGIEGSLRERLNPYGIQVDAVNVTNFTFSQRFTDAIEDKVTAEQQALKALNDLERVKNEAQQVVERARAEAESVRIRGEALRDNPKLVDLEAVQKWDGKLPTIMAGDSVPFLQLPTTTSATR